jgi:hypothetical protein
MGERRFLLLGEKARMRAVFFFSPTIIGFMEAGFLSATSFGFHWMISSPGKPNKKGLNKPNKKASSMMSTRIS